MELQDAKVGQRHQVGDIVMHDGEAAAVAETLGDGDVLLRNGRWVPESNLSTPPLEVGDKVRLIDLRNTSYPMPPLGSTGEVTRAGEYVTVRWDGTSYGTTHGMYHWRYALTHRNTTTKGSTMTTTDTTIDPKVGDIVRVDDANGTIRSIDGEEPRYLVRFEGGDARWVNTDAITDRFKVGDRVMVRESAEHSRAAILGDVSLPAVGTLVAVDGPEPTCRVAIEGADPRWVYSDMIEPAPKDGYIDATEPAPKFAVGDKVTVERHPSRASLSITEAFPFEATILEMRGFRDSLANERTYQVTAKSGHTWVVLESMLTKREEQTPEPTEEQRKIAALEAQVARLRSDLARRDREMDTLVEDAHTYADTHSLCHEFDQFMVDHGLPARERDYEVEVTFNVSAIITVRANDEEGAQESAEDEAQSILVDMDAAIEGKTDLTGVDTRFYEVGDAERQD